MIVDDEVLTSEHIARLLTKQFVDVVGCYDNAFDALQAFQDKQPDVLFLDIEMPEISGMDLAEKLRTIGYEGELIFITAYNEYALQAFDVNATDYLLKPVMEEDIARAMQRVNKRSVVATKATKRQVKISFFGHVSVYVDEEPTPIRWKTLKCVEVFAYMVLQTEHSDISKWKIIEAIWPNNTKESADTNFRSTISRLNKTLRESQTGLSVISTGSGYQLQRKDVDVYIDAKQIEKLAIESIKLAPMNVVVFEQAVQSYQGMLLEELDSEWCRELQRKYHLYFVQVIKELISYYGKEMENPLKILQMTERWKQFDSYDERLRELELQIHCKLYGVQGMKRYYSDYCHVLRSELGIEPHAAFQELYEKYRSE